MVADSSTTWLIGGGRAFDLRTPAVMAILNVTPDSFSDGGQLSSIDDVVRRATTALEEGADILDVGGESTRPGAEPVGAVEQIRRVVPAIEAILNEHPWAVVSVDTTLAEVAGAAISAGAAIVNDVSACEDDINMRPVIADRKVGCVLMHRVRRPNRDTYSDRYDRPLIGTDPLFRVRWDLHGLFEAAIDTGVTREHIVVDPGLGFGKTVEQNLELIRRTDELRAAFDRPVLSGLSRKSFVGRATLRRDSDPWEREAGSVALTALHRTAGASVFRVHDVPQAVQALRAADALHQTAL